MVMQEKNMHSPLTKPSHIIRKAPPPCYLTITDHGVFAFIRNEHDTFVAYALTTTAAPACLIGVTLRSWSHFRFRVAQVARVTT